MSAHASLLAIARSIAVEAAHLARQRRQDGVEIAASKSSPEDVVTAADREVEQLIRRRLSEARPDDGFLGEESGAGGGTSGLTWVVDPIDGTVNYLYGIPSYAVSIAVVEGEPEPETWTALAGAVVNGATGEVYTASRGGGAERDGVALHVTPPASLSLALVGTGFGYDAARRMRQGAVVQELLGSVRDIRRIGSAALDLCSVASGSLNAYYERGLNPWDLAAGALVAEEAGAVVAGFDGRPAGNGLLIAAPEPIFSELEALLRRLRADEV
ncbi:inositol monophosphatase [Rathayibacter sp. VKM Ac-2804]|uniref:inositol monophosphatase family protein n=1 Tax=unclassified Rathayibacter TaxID=2609250 RepID=UPI00132F4B8A|nr:MULTISPECIES: inositol monophosphatase family protein [unclassified Rathayibacter]NRG41477.1 inositol monophosphatase [Rathayibacter sp. VKM Ac-2835]QHF25345.1 inositol monophosphatase [Rathayibacter sp. VKM Ac-2804]